MQDARHGVDADDDDEHEDWFVEAQATSVARPKGGVKRGDYLEYRSHCRQRVFSEYEMVWVGRLLHPSIHINPSLVIENDVEIEPTFAAAYFLDGGLCTLDEKMLAAHPTVRGFHRDFRRYREFHPTARLKRREPVNQEPVALVHLAQIERQWASTEDAARLVQQLASLFNVVGARADH